MELRTCLTKSAEYVDRVKPLSARSALYVRRTHDSSPGCTHLQQLSAAVYMRLCWASLLSSQPAPSSASLAPPRTHLQQLGTALQHSNDRAQPQADKGLEAACQEAQGHPHALDA
eukprot:65226-Chlamydomonas_euryale.AAC.2